MIDIFGRSMTFENDSSRKLHTIAGGITSILLAIICTTLALVLGSDFYLRKVETVTSSEKINDSTTLYLNDLPLLMAFFSNGFIIDDPFEVVDLNVKKMTINGSVSIEYFNKFDICTPNKYKLYQQAVEALINSSPFKLICYNSENSEYVKNSLGENDSITYFFEITKCNPSLRKCHPNLDNILKGFNSVIYYVNDYLNPTDFASPLRSYIESISQLLIKGYTKSHYLKTARFTFSSDDGWLLENITTHDYLSIFSLTGDINTTIISRYNNKEILYSLALQTTKVTKTTVRRYMKITDVFAKIGGLVTILYYAFKAIISIYSSFKYTYLIRDLFLEATSKDCIQKVTSLIQPQSVPLNSKKLAHDPTPIQGFNEAKVYEGDNQSSVQIITPTKRNGNWRIEQIHFLKFVISSLVCCYNKNAMKIYRKEKFEVHRALSIKSYIGFLKQYTTNEYFRNESELIS